ncbi:hypothetical protein T310_2093 [Rasamsonia emersonii CBS 393.64]|uniref:Uncharacterized protein n=1 Tax=Rasamsonia emersonii (strain ATCC 16479 / CBS 393.64 / IMI 116815) TaxID=1408163 RepID=A0A0F4Z007_RASE3|nr:hypothetical protein T310_2093 [Rasamsonia emersonii CBS 393.64]KKA23862.1 hypothetical protein T310_2093 [Rasamsonia emersonii CBS 393.64]
MSTAIIPSASAKFDLQYKGIPVIYCQSVIMSAPEKKNVTSAEKGSQLPKDGDKEVIQVDKDQQEADVLEQLLRKIRRDVQQAEFLSALGLKDMSDALTRKIGDNIEYIKKKEPGLVARGVLPPAEEVEAEYQLQRSQKKLRESESGNVSGSGR